MLWYKAWLETRSRFLIALVGITALCSYYVFHGNREKLSFTNVSYYSMVINGGHATLALTWIVAVTLLMMGGLLREKAAGASSFTLAMPVSRARLMGVRISMGLTQAMTLVIVPWTAMFLVSSFTGWTHSMFQAGFYMVLLAGGGLVFFAMALLISSLVEGEYTAPLVSLGAVIPLAIGFGRESLRAYNPFTFITGEQYFDRHTMLLVGPIPWMHIAVSVFLAALLMAVSVKVIQAREF
jgi:hypothetical protein